MGDASAPVDAIVDAADLLAAKIDVLIDRLTDKVLASPLSDSPPPQRMGSTRCVSDCW